VHFENAFLKKLRVNVGMFLVHLCYIVIGGAPNHQFVAGYAYDIETV